MVAAAVLWATPLASFVVPEGGILLGVLNAAIKLLLQVCVVALPFMLSEEIGMRGYLQPRLMSLGRRRALLLVGLVWATWHMPLIFLTPLLPVGNKLISLPLFYGAIVAGSFFYGYLRIYTGSVWPSTIAHGVHNHAWGILGVFTATSYPVIVNKYLGGGLRDTDRCWWRARSHLGRPQAQERYGPSTIGRRGSQSRPGSPHSPGGPHQLDAQRASHP